MVFHADISGLLIMDVAFVACRSEDALLLVSWAYAAARRKCKI